MMDEEAIANNNEQLRYVLLKNPENRSYDDLLVLKGFIVRSEFMQKNLAGIVNPKQMNDLCRQLGLETYSVGDTVFNQGDIGDKVFILLSGACDLRVRYRIDLTQGESEIREKFIKTYKERGSYFGERALQFDEPRSGTVIASAHTNLITVNKNSYISVIKEARLDSSNEVVASAEQLGTKESVITVLSKMRDKRTNQELDAVAGYLFRRIPFFQRFTMPQLIELCRVAETVSVWGRSILFKQGSIGQAFYVVLTGTVEVWVNNTEAQVVTPANRVQHKAHDVTDGLGVKVNQLVSGEIFGERALENEDSMRMASIVTCEGNTELIIISREDYHNLVYVMMHADSMNRLTLLRRTDLFRTVDVQHLKSLARFMEPRKYQLNETLYKVGSKALEIIIIESGECRVETEIREGLDQHEQAELERQRRTGYLEPTALHDGAYHPPDEHGHHARGGAHGDTAAAATAAAAGGRSHTPFQDTAALTNSTESAGGRPISQPSGTSGKRKFSLPKITASSKNKGGAEATGIVKPPPLSLDPVNSVAAKIRMKRLQTQQMISVGKSHRINLGRIAPNSVLAMYVTSGSLADDVFHPETVIASTLVHAYTIGKHDFFNHLPKDTRFAIEKIIADYKAPELTSLWQSMPKKMDEELWKKEKAWKLFKQDMAHDHRRNSNILDAYKKLEAVHLSANSGNDRYTTINLKNQALIQSRDLRLNGTLIQVGTDWGLRHDSTSDHNSAHATARKEDGAQDAAEGKEGQEAARRNTETGHKHHAAHRKSHHEPAQEAPAHPGHRTHAPTVHHPDLNEKYHADIAADEQAHPLHRHAERGPHMTTAEIMGGNTSLISSAVSHMLRNRLNHAHFGESKLKKELFSIHTEQPSSTVTAEFSENSAPADETAQLLGGAPDHGAHAFYLVQMHRESSKNTSGGLLDNAKRMVRCYMRLCGACDSTNAAKQLADAQMENIYLTLFRSDPQKEKELLLNWSAFKGYDSISLSDTDHFLIFCRGAPILFASISPSRNIFNSPFPALCKQRGQRYACVVVNKLNPMHVQKPESRDSRGGHHHHHHHKHHHHHHHHHSSHHSTTDPQLEDSDSDDEHGRKHNHKHGGHRKNANSSSAHSLPRTDDRPTTSETAASSAAAVTATSVAAMGNASSKSKGPVQGSVKARTNSMDNDLGNQSAKPSTAPDANAAASSAGDAAGPHAPSEYLLEFSVLTEVLLTCSSRMECLKYAITRFGTMTEPSALGTNGHHLTAAESEGRVGAKGKIYLRPFNPAQPDRILAMLHSGKRACVVPLFNWILVNDDTTKTLDFTNGFNHAAQQLVFMEEEIEHSRLSAIAFGTHDTRAVIGSSSAAEDKIDASAPLFKSFAEVGLLHSEHIINEDNSRYMPKNELFEQHRQTNEKTLQLLERDLTSKEMSQNVIKAVANSGVEFDNTLDTHMRSAAGKRVSIATSSSSISALRSSKEETSNVEARLKALNETVSTVDKLMSTHDKLCEVEHVAELTAAASGTFHGPISKSPVKFRPPNLTVTIPGSLSASESAPTLGAAPNAAVAKHNSLARTKELIAKRMNVIESLQNLQFQRVTVDNVMDGYNARVNREIAAAVAAAAQGATPLKRSDSSSRGGLKSGKASNLPNLLAGNFTLSSGASATGGVAVGKRLADSIQLLSDSLASKIK